MSRVTLSTPDAPAAIGPYAQAIAVSARELVFLSGQVGIDPATGALVDGGLEAQARQVMRNLGAVLSAASLTFDDVVRCTVYLTDLEQFGTVNAIYGSFFSAGRVPARATIQVSRLPKDALVEIDAIAAR
ncbi:MAG: reactive intermediate/imine deaminase [Myxococcales bacterium]